MATRAQREQEQKDRKTSVLLRQSDLQQLIDIADDEGAICTANVIRAILATAFPNDGFTMPEFTDIREKLAFRQMPEWIEYNQQKYAERCAVEREKALKREADKRKEREANNNNPCTTVHHGAPRSTDEHLYDNEYDNDNENDNNKTICASNDAPCTDKKPSKAEYNAHFEELWELYPIKRGKTQVSATTRKKLFKVSVEDMREAIARYENEVANATFDQSLMIGSTWFNGRYEDYIGDTYEPAPQQAKQAENRKDKRKDAYHTLEENRDLSFREE